MAEVLAQVLRLFDADLEWVTRVKEKSLKIIKPLEFSPQQRTLSLASSRSHENETISRLRARLYGVGEPHEGEVTRLGGLTRLHDRWGDNMRDYVDRRVTPPVWGPHLHVNRPLKPEKTTDISQRQQRFPRKMTSAEMWAEIPHCWWRITAQI